MGRSITQVNALLRPPQALVNSVAVAGWTPIASAGGGYASTADDRAGAKVTLSGALTAGVLATALSLTGQGVIEYLSIAVVDATARTMRAKVTIDGVVVFDFTSASAAQSAVGGVLIGSPVVAGPSLAAIPFNSSFLLEIASSLTETDKLTVGARYRVN